MIINRRQVIAGAAATAALPLVTEAKTENIHEDLYWEAQSHIDQLENELQEMRAHALVIKANKER
jgi:hypothetical protein